MHDSHKNRRRLSLGKPSKLTMTVSQVADLAKKLRNPIANLISIPLQYNYDADIGPDEDGTKSQRPSS